MATSKKPPFIFGRKELSQGGMGATLKGKITLLDGTEGLLCYKPMPSRLMKTFRKTSEGTQDEQELLTLQVIVDHVLDEEGDLLYKDVDDVDENLPIGLLPQVVSILSSGLVQTQKTVPLDQESTN